MLHRCLRILAPLAVVFAIACGGSSSSAPPAAPPAPASPHDQALQLTKDVTAFLEKLVDAVEPHKTDCAASAAAMRGVIDANLAFAARMREEAARDGNPLDLLTEQERAEWRPRVMALGGRLEPLVDRCREDAAFDEQFDRFTVTREVEETETAPPPGPAPK